MAQRKFLLGVLIGTVVSGSLVYLRFHFDPAEDVEVRHVTCPNNSQIVNTVITEKTFEQRQAELFQYMATPTYMCHAIQRLGKWGDGGWNICLDEQFVPKKEMCLVYSFGISNDFSFDDAVANNFLCEVHSFDPSMRREDHKHAARVWFHNLGVWDKDEIKDNGWKMKTVGSIKKMLKHEERLLDVYKMDVEFAESQIIPNMIETGEFRKIRQFCFELHFSYYTAVGVSGAYKILKSLEQEGLRLFHTHFNPVCSREKIQSKVAMTKCVELCYVNFAFITKKAA